MRSDSSFLSTPFAILLGSIIIAVSILLSVGVISVGKLAGSAAQVPNASAPPQAAAPAAPTNSKVSVDDDPVLGDKNAPVTIVEFSDYECPFCKRHFEQTYPQLLKDYVDTGKVKLVFR